MDSSSVPRDRPANLDQNIDYTTRTIGRPTYLLGRFGFAGAWIAVNILEPRFGRPAFDPNPFPLPDGMLSLAALVSTTVVLIAQNRQTRIEQQHMHLSLQMNLLTEQKVAKIIDLMEELRRDMPTVKNRHDPQAASFAQGTDARQVLSAIEEVGLAKDPAESDATVTTGPGDGLRDPGY